MLLQLGAQVANIAREYGLPSVSGLSLYLSLPEQSAPSPFADIGASSHPRRFAPRLTAETWYNLWSTHFENTGGEYMNSGGPSLPIAGRIEFDFDLTRATWLYALVNDAQSRPLPHQHPLGLPSEHDDPPASQAQILSLSLGETTSDRKSDSVQADDDGSVLADFIETTQSVPFAPLVNDSGFAEPGIAAKDAASDLSQLNRSFTFPPSASSPSPISIAQRSLIESCQLGENDWTAQLDRLREISETSMPEGVEHAGLLGSLDASGSLGELLISIVEEERDDEVAPLLPHPLAGAVAAGEAASVAHLGSPFPPSLSCLLPYPVVQPYPSVYPIINVYPSVERFGTALQRLHEQRDVPSPAAESPEPNARREPFVPDIALSPALDSVPPTTTYDAPSFPFSFAHDASAGAGGPASPLPSPTITPAFMSRSSTASSSDAQDYPVDFEEYTLEVTDALSSTLDYSGELDSPPLGEDDDYFVLEGGRAPYHGHPDNESDAESQSSAEEDDAVDVPSGGVAETDDACRTFDSSPLPPPPEPVLFAFPSLAESRELLDAAALFVLEGIAASLIVICGGGLPLKIACPPTLPDDAVDAFSHAVPLAVIYRDAPTAGEQAVSAKAGASPIRTEGSNVEENAASRFDLVLLDISQELDQLGKANSLTSPQNLLDNLTGKPVYDPFSLSRLATSRRVAHLAIGTAQHPRLHDVLYLSETSSRIELTNGHPAVIFADADAVGDLDYPRSAFWDGEDDLADSPA
ncbi:salivary gland secretion 1 [Rhodotorula toruloides]|uniref:Salivary gland secretion 1 n=1 Tax=Rhodotorula toruloides TaxID=5286 RepID=A0A511KD56_RHOTO|nr:salivary gland secretion 1 [Rhodotorula toruloides]